MNSRLVGFYQANGFLFTPAMMTITMTNKNCCEPTWMDHLGYTSLELHSSMGHQLTGSKQFSVFFMVIYINPRTPRENHSFRKDKFTRLMWFRGCPKKQHFFAQTFTCITGCFGLYADLLLLNVLLTQPSFHPHPKSTLLGLLPTTPKLGKPLPAPSLFKLSPKEL